MEHDAAYQQDMKTKADEHYLQMRANTQVVDDLDRLRKNEKDLPTRTEMMKRLIQRAVERLK